MYDLCDFMRLRLAGYHPRESLIRKTSSDKRRFIESYSFVLYQFQSEHGYRGEAAPIVHRLMAIPL